MRRLFGTVTCSTGDLQLVALRARLAGWNYEQPLAGELVGQLEPEGLHVLTALALLTRVGDRTTSPYLRCSALLSLVDHGENPHVVPRLDVPLELYAQMDVPDSVRRDESNATGMVFKVPASLLFE